MFFIFNLYPRQAGKLSEEEKGEEALRPPEGRVRNFQVNCASFQVDFFASFQVDFFLRVAGLPDLQFHWHDSGSARCVKTLLFLLQIHLMYSFCRTGNTHKRMQKETGATILIRGKGSVKPGSRGKDTRADDDDDLHVRAVHSTLYRRIYWNTAFWLCRCLWWQIQMTSWRGPVPWFRNCWFLLTI